MLKVFGQWCLSFGKWRIDAEVKAKKEDKQKNPLTLTTHEND